MLVRMSVKLVLDYDCNRNDSKLAQEVSLKRLTDDLKRFGMIHSISVDMQSYRTVRLLANRKFADVIASVDSDGNSIVTDAMLAMVDIVDVSAYIARVSADKHVVEYIVG